jgi:hypothetical protein
MQEAWYQDDLCVECNKELEGMPDYGDLVDDDDTKFPPSQMTIDSPWVDPKSIVDYEAGVPVLHPRCECGETIFPEDDDGEGSCYWCWLDSLDSVELVYA